MDFDGKTVWITGASSGIGAALAEAFSAKGAVVILSGRNVDALEKVASGLGATSYILPFETTDYGALDDIVKQALAFTGNVDILVNNAGISQRSLAKATSPEVYDRIINVDLLAPIHLTQKLLPAMIAAGSGHIVSISSVAGRIGVPLRTAYCAAKHGLIGYMDALRAEVEQLHNIHVTNILPGSIRTDVSRNALNADGSRRGKSDDVIDNGMEPGQCAAQILDAVRNRTPELIIAEGMELELAQMRQSDAEKLFATTAQLGAHIAGRYDAGDDS